MAGRRIGLVSATILKLTGSQLHYQYSTFKFSLGLFLLGTFVTTTLLVAFVYTDLGLLTRTNEQIFDS
jgi:hypothetical protein